jgi:hypothetical protein
MLVGSVGSALALDMGLSEGFAAEGDSGRLTFGELEPLVALMQETPLGKLVPELAARHAAGVSLKTLTAAGALANARTFGGQDYVGFHTFMALAPALDMASELPKAKSPLPVFKVLHRNTERIQGFGGRASEVLRPVEPGTVPTGRVAGEVLQEATRRADWDGAERLLAALADEPAGEMFNHVQYPVQDSANVHRVVLAWRAWLAIDLVGEEHAHTLLRQSVRFCLRAAEAERGRPAGRDLPVILPELLDQYKLISRPIGTRPAEDAWVEELAWTIFSSDREQAADAAAQALAAGYAPDAVAEAMSVAANLLLLHDPGRQEADDGDKGVGSVHGDSVGVHASDAANAWRNIARVSNHRNAVASLVVGAYHTAGQSGWVRKERWPLRLDAVERQSDPAALLRTAEEAVRAKDQALAGAAIARYGELGGRPRPVFDLLLRFATSEDGALHAEKYYRTVTEEFARTRPAFRWGQLVALARVSASEYGRKSPGYRDASRVLKVEV